MSSKDIILEMLDDVKAHQRNKNELLSHYVQIRLDNSIQTYYKQLLSSYTTLTGYDELNVLKKLAKNN